MMFTDRYARFDEQTGRLNIDMRPAFAVQIRFSPWAEGLRMFRLEGRRWVEDLKDPQIPLLVAGHSKLDSNPLKPFIDAIPAEVIQVVEPIVHNQISILRILTLPHGAQHMAAHNPVLLWLVAEAMNNFGWRLKEVRDLLSLKRVALLKRMIGAGSPAMVRFLQKVRPRHWDQEDLRAILASLRSFDILAVSAKLPEIPTEVLRLCLRERDGTTSLRLLSQQKVVDMATAWDIAQVLQLIDDCRRINCDLAYYHPSLDEQLANCRILADLRKLHDRLTLAYNQQERQTRLRMAQEALIKNGGTFPAPPLPGNQVVVPITSAEELIQEGEEMNHCVGTYVGRVASGRSFIYRVLSPQRATLQVSCDYHGELKWVDQLKLAGNREPDQETWKVIRDWLTDCKVSLEIPF